MIMNKLGIEEGEAITHGLISRAIENAQKKVETHNFEIRKHLLEYDDVMNKQREVIYSQRREILSGADLREQFVEMMEETVEDMIAACAIEKVPAQEWDWQGIIEWVYKDFGFHLEIDPASIEQLNPQRLSDFLLEKVRETFAARSEAFGSEVMDHLIKVIMLQTIDSQWKDHLLSIDHLKEGIGLRGYGQKDPKQEYKKEAYKLFMDMVARIREEVVERIFWVQIADESAVESIEQQQRRQRLVFNLVDEEASRQPVKSSKVGRNDPCPCGSGKKYKKCCGT
jgi:preprotein translocase subunit SecA